VKLRDAKSWPFLVWIGCYDKRFFILNSVDEVLGEGFPGIIVKRFGRLSSPVPMAYILVQNLLMCVYFSHSLLYSLST
jgi:hypothetical protein